MTNDLDTKSPEQLDEVFAVEVADNPPPTGDSEYAWDSWRSSTGYHASADLVLPWLNGQQWSAGSRNDGKTTAFIKRDDTVFSGSGSTFPVAAMKALIRAKRAEKTPSSP